MVVLVLAASVQSSCGGSASPRPDDPLAGTVGEWSASFDELPFDSFLLKVEQRAGIYYLSVDGGPPRKARIADGRIVLPFFTTSNGQADFRPRLEFGMDGDHAAVFVRASHGRNADPGEPTGYFWEPYPVKRLNAAAYDRQAAAKTDRAMYYALWLLDGAIHEWADRHDGELPAAGEVKEDSAFGRWLQTDWVDVEGGMPWPGNPYTGEAMHAGSGPGDYAYERTVDGFTLSGRLHDGTVVSSTDTPPS